MDRIRTKKAFWLLWLFLGVVSCSTGHQVHTYITRHGDFAESDTCYINMEDAIGVDYDTMYLFDFYTFAEEIAEITGIEDYEYPCPIIRLFADEDTQRLILVKQGKCVFECDLHARDKLRFMGGTARIVFKPDFATRWKSKEFTPSTECEYIRYATPIFKVERRQLWVSHEVGYYLYPVLSY